MKNRFLGQHLGRPDTYCLLILFALATLIGCDSQPPGLQEQVDATSEGALTTVESTPTTAVKTDAATIQMIIPDSSIAVGTSADIELAIIGADGALGAATINLTYDPAILTITACEVPEFLGVCNFSVQGELRIAGINAEGLTSDFVYATISTEGLAVGSANLVVSEVPTFANGQGETLPYGVQTGAVVVEN